MPRMEKTVSTTTVPLSSSANWMPITVTTGISALRSAWRRTTARSRTPLARAVRT